MRKYIVLCWLVLHSTGVRAHPMPNSVVNLSVLQGSIYGEAKMPLAELQAALHMAYNNNMAVNTPFFYNYFRQHIQALSGAATWVTRVDSLEKGGETDSAVGSYQQVTVYFTLRPPPGQSLRQFTFNYTAIIHQVITHKILVFVTSDWRNGLQAQAMPVGVIQLDVPTEKVNPLPVSLAPGSWLKGFGSMARLGMQHIQEGTDHLLFLLVLLLPAMLLVNGRRWGGFGGTRYSAAHLLKIVTAFTIGHSITLLIGSLGWLKVPQQPVEVLIAASILVSAAHALRPIFPGREALVAAGFGLVHGMAFAAVLSGMRLSAGTLALSILGFNLGIELMQLFIILITVPWLILLAKTPLYPYVRINGAALAGLAAIECIVERTSGQPNTISTLVNRLIPEGWKLVAALAVFSTATFALHKYLSGKTKKWPGVFGLRD